jgi:hypothetical protein
METTIKLFIDYLLNIFYKKYNIDKNDIKISEHIQFRFECFKYNYIIKHFKIPKLEKNLINEAVLIEYRCFPHLEFLIRNAILNLGKKWSYTVICGNLNYNFIKDICDLISPNIKIIKTKYNNLNQNEYSKFLASIEFWNYLVGEKILIYQEDSFIFKKNISDFLEWDFIGAPFPKNTNSTPNFVGNGGLSLRTKKSMIDVINKISIENTEIYESTKIYMKNNNLTICPEDVYFSLNMQKYGIGKVSDFENAYKFSSESISNPNSFGGHKFWMSDPNWKNKMKKNLSFFKYKPNSNLEKYLLYTNKSSKLNLTNLKPNAFDIDYSFYKHVNGLFINDLNELNNHIQTYAINGLIYHPKQIFNIYPNIVIFQFMDNLFILNDNTIYLAHSFVREFLYNKSFEDLLSVTIKNEKNNDKLNDVYSSLLIIAFIGNINVGEDLINKIIKYKNIQKFNVAFCFNSDIVYDYFINIINKNFIYFTIYFTNEYGTDIQPSLFMYHDISKNYNFKYIIKLHTKSIQKDYNDLTNFLLTKNVTTLKKMQDLSKCNCLGPDEYYMTLSEDIFNRKILNKYIDFVDTNKCFVRGTIFFTDDSFFKKIIKFIKKTDYKSFVFNNLYENNSINHDFSPTHYLERLFGIII